MDPPGAGYELVDVIHASDGEGCGLLGSGGSFEAAQTKLKNLAAKKGAKYVHITEIVTPQKTVSCAENKFSITGVAYRLTKQ